MATILKNSFAWVLMGGMAVAAGCTDKGTSPPGKAPAGGATATPAKVKTSPETGSTTGPGVETVEPAGDAKAGGDAKPAAEVPEKAADKAPEKADAPEKASEKKE